MKIVPLAKAKAELSALVDLVASGEEVTITRRGEAVARLVPEQRASARSRAGDAVLIGKIREAVSQQRKQRTSTIAAMRASARY
jgi:prevent-host-death family protein